MFEKKKKQAAPFSLRGVTQYYIRIKYNKAGELQEKHGSLTLETCHDLATNVRVFSSTNIVQ